MYPYGNVLYYMEKNQYESEENSHVQNNITFTNLED